MGAASIVRDPTIMVAGSAIPPGWMAVGVAIAGLAILTLTLVGVGLDRRDRRRTAAFVREIAAARKAEEQQNLLIAELDHRVKNVLARVAVVAQRSRESSSSMDQFLERPRWAYPVNGECTCPAEPWPLERRLPCRPRAPRIGTMHRRMRGNSGGPRRIASRRGHPGAWQWCCTSWSPTLPSTARYRRLMVGSVCTGDVGPMGARNPYSRSDGRRSVVRRSGLQPGAAMARA